MNLGTTKLSESYQFLLNQSGQVLTLGDGSNPNWIGTSVVSATGVQTISGVKTFQSNSIFNGNVGIGDSNPADKLDVVGNGLISRFAGTTNEYQGIVIQPTQSSASVAKGAFIDFRNENDIALTNLASYHYTNGSNDFFIATTPSGNRTSDRRVERFRIKGNGDTVIGPASGLSLQVIGGIRARGGTPGANGVNNNGYAFSSPGDSDAGMFSSADGQIEFYTNNAEVMRIFGTNVGIGTTTVGAKLDISTNSIPLGGNATSTCLKTNAGSLGTLSGNSLPLASLGFLSNNNTSLTLLARRSTAGSDWTSSAIGLSYNVDNTTGVNNSQVWMTAGGSVGIGTNNPQTKLHAFGGAETLRIESSTNQLYVPLVTSEGLSNRVEICNRAGGRFAVYNEQVGDGFNILKNGNVGIGTTDPRQKLHLENGNMVMRSNAPTIGLIDTTQGQYVGDNSNTNAYIHTNNGDFYILPGSTDNGDFQWAVSANNRWPFQINLNNNNATFGGNVNSISFTAVGDGSRHGPGLQIVESTHDISNRAGISLGNWSIGQDSQGNGERHNFYFWDTNGFRGGFAGTPGWMPNDNFYIVNTANTNQYWYYNKQNAPGVASDNRTKSDISNIDTDKALSFIKSITPSTFRVASDLPIQAGFIAQDILSNAKTEDQKEIINNHNTYDENNPDCPILGVADRPILAYLVAAVKEQQKIIDSLKEEIKNINNQL
jgi:hypothetical protein